VRTQFPSGPATRVLSLLAVGVAGGVIALGGAWLAGGFGSTETVRQIVQQPLTPTPQVAQKSGGLTISEIYDRAAPGVVQITSHVVTTTTDIFGDQFPQEAKALGSGFVVDKAGHVVTNYHVVQGARSIHVSFSNHHSVKATLVGSDPTTDVAVLKVDVPARALTPLQLGNSDDLRVGDSVVAIGNPFGFTRTVTAGIVSALQRQIQSPNFHPIGHIIQTDAAINEGNSGGPLLDARGQVVGVNTAISTGNTGEQGNIGIGFAIPINTVKDVAAQLIRSGKVEHAFLGVGVKAISPALARIVRLPVTHGLLVQNVLKGTAAASADLRAGKTNVVVAGESYVIGGDIIVSVDGTRVDSFTQLDEVVSSKAPGDTVTVVFYRGSSRHTMDIKLGRQPTTPPSPG
jgi:S1-C subfamily serine protease